MGHKFELCKFFLGAPVSINIEKRCNHYRLIVACMLSGASRNRPVIVGWSTALRGEVINEKSRTTPEETGSRPTRAGKDRIITHPIGDETGWITARSLGEVGATSVHSKPVFVCSDCTFLDEIHRAALEKKKDWPVSDPAPQQQQPLPLNVRATRPPTSPPTTPPARSMAARRRS